MYYDSHFSTRSDGSAPKPERVSSQPPTQRRNSLARAIALVLMAGMVAVPASAWARTVSVQQLISSGGCNATNGIGAIQEAIDGATNGDVIDVYPGVYVENIDFKGKQVVVQSHSNNPNDTIIDGGKKGSVVIFNKGETPTTVLQGFTITNGKAPTGGGIYLRGMALFADGSYHASTPNRR